MQRERPEHGTGFLTAYAVTTLTFNDRSAAEGELSEIVLRISGKPGFIGGYSVVLGASIYGAKRAQQAANAQLRNGTTLRAQRRAPTNTTDSSTRVGPADLIRTVGRAVTADNYDYELRWGETIVATGQLALESPPTIGERITIGHESGIVKTVLPPFGGRGRIVVQLLAR